MANFIRHMTRQETKHRKEVKSISKRTLKQEDRKDKAAITAHVAKENHVIDWFIAKILDTKSH